MTYVYSKRPSGNTVRPHIEWIYRNFMFDVSVVQIQRRHTSTVDVNSHCRVRCRSSTKNKKHPVHTLSVQGIFTEKFPFLHTSNVSPKNGKSRQEDIRNVYTPVNSLQMKWREETQKEDDRHYREKHKQRITDSQTTCKSNKIIGLGKIIGLLE